MGVSKSVGEQYDAQEDAIDTVMRCAHNLRRELKTRRASNAEIALLVCEERLKEAGWTWSGDGPVNQFSKE